MLEKRKKPLLFRSATYSSALSMALGITQLIIIGTVAVPADSFHAILSPNILKNHWLGHNDPLILKYSDTHVAIYFDSQVPPLVKWPFQLLSKAWEYIKQVYGLFWNNNPHLHVILHSKNFPCISIGHMYSQNIIDCGHESPTAWTDHSSVNVQRLFSTLAEVIQEGAKGMLNTMDLLVCGFEMTEIVLYDIYRHLLGQGSVLGPDFSLDEWMKERDEKKNNKDEPVLWFRAWFLPIYKSYGGASVLNNFYELAYNHWAKRSLVRFYEQMNAGEFIHFWTGAAGANLQHLVDVGENSVFNWTEEAKGQLKQARVDYPLWNDSGVKLNDVSKKLIKNKTRADSNSKRQFGTRNKVNSASSFSSLSSPFLSASASASASSLSSSPSFFKKKAPKDSDESSEEDTSED